MVAASYSELLALAAMHKKDDFDELWTSSVERYYQHRLEEEDTKKKAAAVSLAPAPPALVTPGAVPATLPPAVITPQVTAHEQMQLPTSGMHLDVAQLSSMWKARTLESKLQSAQTDLAVTQERCSFLEVLVSSLSKK